MPSLDWLQQRARGAMAKAPWLPGLANQLAVWRLLPGWSRYHGLWGPGIHLLRNLSLRHKSLLVGSLVSVLSLSLLLHLAQVRLAELALSARAVDGVLHMRLISALQQQVMGHGP